MQKRFSFRGINSSTNQTSRPPAGALPLYPVGGLLFPNLLTDVPRICLVSPGYWGARINTVCALVTFVTRDSNRSRCHLGARSSGRNRNLLSLLIYCSSLSILCWGSCWRNINCLNKITKNYCKMFCELRLLQIIE